MVCAEILLIRLSFKMMTRARITMAKVIYQDEDDEYDVEPLVCVEIFPIRFNFSISCRKPVPGQHRDVFSDETDLFTHHHHTNHHHEDYQPSSSPFRQNGAI